MPRQRDLVPGVDPVQQLAEQMRQSLRTCSAHPAGPLAAFDRCLGAVRAGAIDADQFQEIGRRLVRASHKRASEYDASGGDGAQSRNEARLVQFVTALFTLGDVEAGES